MRVRFKKILTLFLPLATIYVIIGTILNGQQQWIDTRNLLRRRDVFHTSFVYENEYQKFNILGGGVNEVENPGADLWPREQSPYDDRIIKQILYRPHSHQSHQLLRSGMSQEKNLKVIFAPSGLGSTMSGRTKFIEDECPVNTCSLVDDYSQRLTADLVLYQNEYIADLEKPKGQIWMLWLLESPINSGLFDSLKDKINWTASYRADSTIVSPYEKFVHFDNFTSLPAKASKNYAKGKTKKIAWFVSNCASTNKRFEYAQELSQYISVDIYGACGPFRCSRYKREECNELLNHDYKFYLAFENSNCVHYITEKLFWNGLFNDVIPIVMGARRADYEAMAPPHSFIHVEDFANAKELAQYLHKLDTDDELYNSYFRWKNTGYFLDTKFWCRLCALLHGVPEMKTSQYYLDVEKWWRNNRTCVENRWDTPGGYIENWNEYVIA